MLVGRVAKMGGVPAVASIKTPLRRRAPRLNKSGAITQAVLLADAHLPVVLPPLELAVAAFAPSPLSIAPECLLMSLDADDLLQPAPGLVDPRAQHTAVVPSEAAVLAGALATINSAKLEAAACLASPMVLEENAAEILRTSAAELALERQMQLELRYASEVRLVRQRSFDSAVQIGAASQDKQATTRGSSLLVLLPSPEVKAAVEDMLEAHGHKNRLVLDERRTLPKPDGSISMEEPDHAALLSSCLASVDQPASV